MLKLMKSQAQGQFKKSLRIVLSASLVITILSGCMSQGAPEEEETRVLRIALVQGNSSTFDNMQTQFTDIWDFTHKNVELEFMAAIDYDQMRYATPMPTEPGGGDGEESEQPTPAEELQALMESSTPPDLVIFGQEHLEHLLQKNMLAPLDPLITKSGFNTDDFAPAVEDTLRKAGEGQLFALAPTFSSSALLYNRGLFLEHGVTLPQDGMTWDEMFNLATLISGGEGENQIYGFNFQPYYGNNIFSQLRTYTAPSGLRMVDEANETMLVNTEQWANVWNKFIDLHQQGVFPGQPDFSNMKMEDRQNNPFMHDAFMSGKLAMTFTQYYRLDEIITANRNADNMEGYEFIDWDVVTLPTHPETPNEGGVVTMNPIMGINARAENKDDAWDLLSFIHGEDWASLKGRSSRQLMTRTSHIEPKDNLEFNIAAFTQLTPTEGADPNRYNYNIPYFWEIENIGRMKFEEVVNDQKSVSQALQEWENEGNMAIQRYKERMNGDLSDMTQEKINLMRAAGEL